MSCVAQPAMAQTLPSMRSRRFEAHTKTYNRVFKEKGQRALDRGGSTDECFDYTSTSFCLSEPMISEYIFRHRVGRNNESISERDVDIFTIPAEAFMC